jgi:hypothetical protein
MAAKICHGDHACHLGMLASLEKIDEIWELTASEIYVLHMRPGRRF